MPIYSGDKDWAPCAHDDAGRWKLAPWINEVLANDAWEPQRCVLALPHALEEAMNFLGDVGYGHIDWPFDDLQFSFYADMWVGVWCKVFLQDGSTKELWTEADDFTLGLLRTIERLKELVKTAPRRAEVEEEDE